MKAISAKKRLFLSFVFLFMFPAIIIGLLSYHLITNMVIDNTIDVKKNGRIHLNGSEKMGTGQMMKANLEEWFYQYTDPRKDATRELVAGFGQIGLASTAGKDVAAFYESE